MIKLADLLASGQRSHVCGMLLERLYLVAEFNPGWQVIHDIDEGDGGTAVCEELTTEPDVGRAFGDLGSVIVVAVVVEVDEAVDGLTVRLLAVGPKRTRDSETGTYGSIASDQSSKPTRSRSCMPETPNLRNMVVQWAYVARGVSFEHWSHACG